MKKSIWDKRIPTILGLLLITIGIGLTSYFVRQGAFYFIIAGPTNDPQEVRVTNVSDSTVTVSFSTNGTVIGSLNFGETKEGLKKILDDQDQSEGNITPRKIHSITARNLKPSTKYYFSITSGEETYLKEDSMYELTTGKKIESEPPNQDPISGRILLPDGQSPKETIVYATLEGAQIISTVVKSDGSYILPLNSLRKSDLSSYFDFSKDVNIKMNISGDGYSSLVLLSINQINPVPAVTLSKDYDFTTSFEPEATKSAKLEKLPSFPAKSTTQGGATSPSIVSPQEEQELSDLKPEFKGKALPNETVKIVINSENQIEEEITSDQYGNWYYRPTQELSPGEHTVSITTKDVQGILRTITQSFTVYAQGSQFTDSLSPSPTTSPSPGATTTSTTIVSTTTSVTLPTTTLTLSPTQTPTPTASATNSASISTPPDPGSSSLLNMGFIGITTIILGIVLLLLSRGSMAFL